MESKLKCIFENPVTYAASEKPEKFEPEVNENNDKMKAIEYINSAPKVTISIQFPCFVPLDQFCK